MVPSFADTPTSSSRAAGKRWERIWDNNASGGTDIDSPAEAARIDELAVCVVNVVIEKLAAVLEI